MTDTEPTTDPTAVPADVNQAAVEEAQHAAERAATVAEQLAAELNRQQAELDRPQTDEERAVVLAVLPTMTDEYLAHVVEMASDIDHPWYKVLDMAKAEQQRRADEAAAVAAVEAALPRGDGR